MKMKCIDCGEAATWLYMPGIEEISYCNKCVPRGCSCNYISVDLEFPNGIEGEDWQWVESNQVWEPLEGNNLQYPCAEYWYSKDGWE